MYFLKKILLDLVLLEAIFNLFIQLLYFKVSYFLIIIRSANTKSAQLFNLCAFQQRSHIH